MTSERPASRRRAVLVVAGLLLVAACLRPPITSVGPLLADIERSTGLGSAALGLLGSLPLLAFAAFSPTASWLARRWGLEVTVLVALVVLTAAVALRPLTGVAGLWLGTVAIGAASGVGNVLVPALVKQDMADAAAVATGLYTTSISGAAALGAGLAVPLAGALGGWEWALASVAVLPLVVALTWVPRVVAHRASARSAPVVEPPAPTRGVWRVTGAWQLTGYFGLQSAVFFTTVTWLPTIEGSFGISAGRAGLHLFLFQLVGALIGLATSWWMSRRTDQRLPAVVVGLPTIVGTLGLLLDPGHALLWVLVASGGSSSALVVALAMVTLRTRSSSETASVSGMVQSAGYLVSAAGPLAAGALHALTGTWSAALLLIAAIGVAQTALGPLVGRPDPVLEDRPLTTPRGG